MPRFTRAELESFRDAEVPDLLGPDLRLLFVGINPGLWTAATQTHFAHPVNRFYPALLEAGIITEPISPSAGMTDADRDRLRARGIGITNIVRRATAKASELSADELRAGGLELAATVRRTTPRVVAIAGITAYRTAFGQRHAAARPPARAVRGRRAVGRAEPERAQRPRDGALAGASRTARPPARRG